MSCPQLWNIEQEEHREKEREREAQASEAQRDKGRQRSRGTDKKQRRHFLLEEQHESFVTAVTK